MTSEILVSTLSLAVVEKISRTPPAKPYPTYLEHVSVLIRRVLYYNGVISGQCVRY